MSSIIDVIDHSWISNSKQNDFAVVYTKIIQIFHYRNFNTLEPSKLAIDGKDIYQCQEKYQALSIEVLLQACEYNNSTWKFPTSF